MTETVLRPHAEQAFAHELDALAKIDDKPRPANWRLSPWAVVQYLMGATLPDGTQITPKYVGNQRLIEVAVATLATDRALLLLGVPGTAKQADSLLRLLVAFIVIVVLFAALVARFVYLQVFRHDDFSGQHPATASH